MRVLNHWLRAMVTCLLFLGADVAVAGSPLSYEKKSELAPGDYLLGAKGERRDPVFETAVPIDLGVDLGVGADCGRVDFHSTLRSTLKNMLDSQYFGDLGKDIIASSPMLLACYFSPTWCSILKHSQLSANFLSEMRLSQCQIIDKYVDSRTEDFYRERQTCAREYIAQNGGDLEAAMGACQSVYDQGLSSWAGGKDGKVDTNQLIEASAKWAGFQGDDARESVGLLKALVGDTVVSKGKVSVDFGPRGHAETPATHLMEVQRGFRKSLCDDLLAKVKRPESGEASDQVLTDGVLRGLGGGGEALIDRQTVEALASLPKRRREIACRRLADAMGLTVFSRDLTRSLDILTAAAQNPNLPPNRRQEIDEKRRALKESTELAVTLAKERDGVLTEVQAEVAAAGGEEKARRGSEAVRGDLDEATSEAARLSLLDCGDGFSCAN